MSATWTEFYQGRLLSSRYRKYAARRYAPFLNEIRSYIMEGDRVVEVGCGLATMTFLLIEQPHPFCGFRCLDISPDMVWLSRLNLGNYPVELGDARLPTYQKPDVVHSHGMLEHMCDDDIRKVIAAHKADGARTAIHYVPGNKYEKPSFGDERLMSLEDWQRIASPTHSFTFNDGYDYVLEWEF